MKYAIVIEKIGDGFSAYVPDLPGCIATAPTRDAAVREISEAIRFHAAGIRDDGQPVPEPTTDLIATRSRSDPFSTFTEWSCEIDTEDYADF